MRVSSSSASILAVIDSSDPREALFRKVLLPVFRFWGLPLTFIDVASSRAPALDASAYALILLAQEDILVERLVAAQAVLGKAVSGGAGIVNCDPALEVAVSASGAMSISRRSWAGARGIREARVNEDHFVTELQRASRRFVFAKPVPALPRSAAEATIVLEDDAGEPLLVLRDGPPRIAEWGLATSLWAPDSFGFAKGIDALLWRSMLWAARKPFAIAAFPPFGRFRFDDCRGFWRTPDDLRFLEAMSEFGEVPNLCVCLSALSEPAWRRLAEAADSGRADVSPHVLEPEVGIFNVAGEVDESLGEDPLVTSTRALFARHACRMSTGLSDHNHELSPRGLRIARALGMKSRMNVLRIGEFWDGVHRTWKPGPFGSLHYALDAFIDAPDLFVAINHHASFAASMTQLDASHFLCTTFGGFTDDRWDFLNGLVDETGRKELDLATDRLVQHAELGLNSLFFVGSISHTHFTRHLSNADWRAILSRYRAYVDRHGYRPRSYDRIADYAAWRSRLTDVSIEPAAAEDGKTALWGLLARDESGETRVSWTPLVHAADVSTPRQAQS